MKALIWVGIGVLAAVIAPVPGWAQAPPHASHGSPAPGHVQGSTERAPNRTDNPVVLDWVPPELDQLSAQAASKSSFTFDRTMLGLVAGAVPGTEPDVRRAVDKVDGVSVHLLHFGDGGIPDEAKVDAMRAAYHLRGWKHLVTTTSAGGPIHDGKADVWLVLDGVNIRGAVVLVEGAKNLSLVTLTGNLSPADVLHLRGHFGIPWFDADGLTDAKDK
jgi:hypothetical protein